MTTAVPHAVADKQTYFLTIAPGVDAALLLAICICLVSWRVDSCGIGLRGVECVIWLGARRRQMTGQTTSDTCVFGVMRRGAACACSD